MLILRVEDEEGHGPWFGKINPWKYLTPEERDHFYTHACKDVYADVVGFTKDYCVGLQSLQLYIEWFNENVRISLEKQSYYLKIYSIHKNYIKFGERQVAFKKLKAIEKKIFKPTDLEGIKNYLDKVSKRE